MCESVDHNVTSNAHGYDKWNCTTQSNFLSIMDFNLDNIHRFVQIMLWLRKASIANDFLKCIFELVRKGASNSELIQFTERNSTLYACILCG